MSERRSPCEPARESAARSPGRDGGRNGRRGKGAEIRPGALDPHSRRPPHPRRPRHLRASVRTGKPAKKTQRLPAPPPERSLRAAGTALGRFRGQRREGAGDSMGTARGRRGVRRGQRGGAAVGAWTGVATPLVAPLSPGHPDGPARSREGCARVGAGGRAGLARD